MDQVKDIVPELLEAIEKEYKNGKSKDETIKRLIEILKNAKSDYSHAHEYSIQIGDLLVETYKNNLINLPDNKMYYNIADRVLNPTMKEAFNDVSSYAADVQTELNHQAGLGIKGIKPDLNQDRIDGIVNRLAEADNFDDIKWILDEPVKNFCQSIVDDTVKKNVQFHHDLGLSPKITRKEIGNCCDWCKQIVGTYNYPNDVPDDIYKRHRHCRCEVLYNPADGSKKKRDIWTKKWK